MPIAKPDTANYWLTCLTIDPVESGTTRDQVLTHLDANDIEARPLWKPLHLQPIFQDKVSIGGEFAASLFDRGLCLPSGSGMSDSQRQFVIDSITYKLKRSTQTL